MASMNLSDSDIDDITLNDDELRQIKADVWRELKVNPNAARQILIAAGWIIEPSALADGV